MNNLLLRLTALILIITISTTQRGYAQYWERTYGVNVIGQRVTPTPDGGFLAAGSRLGISDHNAYFLKTNANGDVVWQSIYPSSGQYLTINDFVGTPDGGGLAVGVAVDTFTGDYNGFVLKVAPNGDFPWFYDLGTGFTGWAISQAAANYYVAGTNNAGAPFLCRLTPGVGVSWQQTYPTLGPADHIDLTASPGGFLMGGGFMPDQDIFLLQTTPLGVTVWDSVYANPNGFDYPDGLAYNPAVGHYVAGFYNSDNGWSLNRIDPSGNILVTSPFNGIEVREIIPLPTGNMVIPSADTLSGGMYLAFSEVDPMFSPQWYQNYAMTGLESFGFSAKTVPAGGYIICGYKLQTDSIKQLLLIRTDSIGNTYEALVTGSVYWDSDIPLDCARNASELGFADIIVEAVAQNGVDRYLSSTDANGLYTLNLPYGDYNITARPPATYWDACINNVPILLNNTAQFASVDIGLRPSTYCPAMSVDISTAYIRRCFPVDYAVTYCNQGPVPSPPGNTYIDIVLDSFMNTPPVISGGFASAQTGLRSYRIFIGSVPPLTCNTFHISVLVDCNAPLGYTHCTRARIYPDSLCNVLGWAGNTTDIDAYCNNNINVMFDFKNIGAVPVSNRQYTVIEDVVMTRSSQINLNGNETLPQAPVPVPNGQTVFITLQQAPNHPYYGDRVVVVEGCNATAGPGVPRAFYPTDDGVPTKDEDCRQNVDSFDPNDKMGFPIGLDSLHFINDDQTLEYLIRFQNTGTDTAFRIVLLDSLSAYLDINTFRPLTSSHPYTYRLFGNGVLEVTFDPIALLDSNTNEAASHGFFRFEITPVPDLAEGTRIENFADIFFDYNAPVRTPMIFHTIGGPWFTLLSTYTPRNSTLVVTAIPNPFSDQATVVLSETPPGESVITVFDLTGRLVEEKAFTGDRVSVSRNNLSSGIYYFNIKGESGHLASGKFMIR